MFKLLMIATGLLTISISTNASADCIETELLKQVKNMEKYTPDHIWEALKDTPVPAKLKQLAADPRQLENIKEGMKPFILQLKQQLNSETAKNDYLDMVESKLNMSGQQNILIWEVIVLQSAARCIKSGDI